jgi:hypothetical protein
MARLRLALLIIKKSKGNMKKMDNVKALNFDKNNKCNITMLADYFRAAYNIRDSIKGLTDLIIKTLHITKINGSSMFNLCRKNNTCELSINQFIAQCFPAWKKLVLEKYPDANITKDLFNYTIATNKSFDKVTYNNDLNRKKELVRKLYLSNVERLELLSLQIKLCNTDNYIK